MATISGALTTAADFASNQPTSTYVLAALPITFLLLFRFVDEYATVNNAGALFLVTTVTGAYGFAVQFLGESKLGDIERTVNGAEILIPVIASIGLGVFTLWWFLPGEPGGYGAPSIRAAIDATEFAADKAPGL